MVALSQMQAPESWRGAAALGRGGAFLLKGAGGGLGLRSSSEKILLSGHARDP